MNTMKTQITETAHREHHKQPTGCVNWLKIHVFSLSFLATLPLSLAYW
jgi:hypothetical protein